MLSTLKKIAIGALCVAVSPVIIFSMKADQFIDNITNNVTGKKEKKQLTYLVDDQGISHLYVVILPS